MRPLLQPGIAYDSAAALDWAEATFISLLPRRRSQLGRPKLLRALRYERALAYEAAGQPKRARADLERLCAEAPGYEDVATRLGMATMAGSRLSIPSRRQGARRIGSEIGPAPMSSPDTLAISLVRKTLYGVFA